MDSVVDPTHILSNQVQIMAVKLPNIYIDIFNGKTDYWKTFFSLFNATIHNNSNLNNVQHFYYLKSFLKDEPLNLIKELELVEENYVKALDILKNRYDNKVININYHLKSIFEMSTVTKGTASYLRDFIININQHLNALKSMSLPIDEWDLILVYLLSHKIDVHTHKCYELERNPNDLPTLK